MRHVERIQLSGFKSIREIRCRGLNDRTVEGLPLKNVNILIGANGSGKSNFLSFFRLLREFIENDPLISKEDAEKDRADNLRLYVSLSGGPDRLMYFGRKVTKEIVADIWFEEDENPPATPILSYDFRLVPSESDAMTVGWESCSLMRMGGPPSPTHFAAGYPGSRALYDDTEPSRLVREKFRQMGLFQVYHFPDTLADAPARQISNIEDNRFLRPQGENLAAILYLLMTRHPASYRQIVELVRLVFPFFEDFKLAPREVDKNTIKLEWKERGEDSYRDAAYLSDGALRFMCLATLLLQPVPPGLILIDEPELGLHPYAIGMLADLLQAASKTNQVIVSTQSVTLLNQFEAEDIVVVEREKEEGVQRYETIFRRLNRAGLEQWLEDYGIGDLWEKNVIGGRP